MVKELEDFKNSCRFCLEKIGHKKSWKITEKMQQKFYKLTNVQVCHFSVHLVSNVFN